MEQIDLRLLVGALAVLAGGVTKGVTGIGLPVVATPILAVLYDLPTAIAVVIIPTVLTDAALVYRFRDQWREIYRLIPIIPPALVGIVIGTQILVRIDPQLLKIALGSAVLLFVAMSWFNFIPRRGDSFSKRWAPGFGLAAGILQGASGTSAPVVTIFLLQVNLDKAVFLFVINAFFLLVDTSQVFSLLGVGLYTPKLFFAAGIIACLALPALFLTLRLQKYISDRLFRKAVLVVLTLTGIVLIVNN
ncbi:MAG: sulfite exporter TauE/SafE family protein [Acidobacteriota bacterium]|nr:sulfite exporter TauE/SafE family protein [Acidobacteriota bacterium]